MCNNVLLKHLTDLKKCPNAPAEVRKAAAQAIQGKKQSSSLQGNVYDLTELDKINKGMAPSGFQDDIQQLGTGSGAGTWSIDALLASRGVSDI